MRGDHQNRTDDDGNGFADFEDQPQAEERCGNGPEPPGLAEGQSARFHTRQFGRKAERRGKAEGDEEAPAPDQTAAGGWSLAEKDHAGDEDEGEADAGADGGKRGEGDALKPF